MDILHYEVSGYTFLQNVVTFLPKHTASFFVSIVLGTAPQALVKDSRTVLDTYGAALYSVRAEESVPRAVFCVFGLLQLAEQNCLVSFCVEIASIHAI
jgi:hypothetical protein